MFFFRFREACFIQHGVHSTPAVTGEADETELKQLRAHLCNPRTGFLFCSLYDDASTGVVHYLNLEQRQTTDKDTHR